MKTGMKQQNLFGQPVVEDSGKGVSAKGKKKPAGKEKSKTDYKKKSESPFPDAATGGFIAGPEDEQMDDDSQVTSNLDSHVQEVETQLEETQLIGSSPPGDTEVDTQPGTETQTEEEQTQPETPIGEDDSEPVSRSAWSPSNPRAKSWKFPVIRLLIGQPRHHERRQWDRSLSENLEVASPPCCAFCARVVFWCPDLYCYVRIIMTSNDRVCPE